jgi:hypothetical protein
MIMSSTSNGSHDSMLDDLIALANVRKAIGDSSCELTTIGVVRRVESLVKSLATAVDHAQKGETPSVSTIEEWKELLPEEFFHNEGIQVNEG